MYFSIVIPLYNKQNHIQRAIRSVLTQNYPHFELIIVDDGSTDDSFKIAASITDSRIKIMRQNNQGVSIARNNGVIAAKYDWIAFLDADDEWLPNFLAEMHQLIQDFPNCGIYGSAKFCCNGINNYNFNSPSPSLILGWRGKFNIYFDHVYYFHPYHSSAVVVSRKDILNCGGFPAGMKIGEDIITWSKIAIENEAAYINSPLSIYHTEAENRTSTTIDDIQAIIKKYTELLNHLSNQEYVEPLHEMIVHYEIMQIELLIKAGKFSKIKKILSKIQYSKKYHNKIIKIKKTIANPLVFIMLFIIRRIKSLIRYKHEV